MAEQTMMSRRQRDVRTRAGEQVQFRRMSDSGDGNPRDLFPRARRLRSRPNRAEDSGDWTVTVEQRGASWQELPIFCAVTQVGQDFDLESEFELWPTIRADRLRISPLDEEINLEFIANFIRLVDRPEGHTGFSSMLVRITEMPIPIFGSPPSAWEKLWDHLGTVSSRGLPTAIAIASAADGHPVLAIFTGTSAIAIWFGTPAARIARRSFGRYVAKKVGEEFREADER